MSFAYPWLLLLLLLVPLLALLRHGARKRKAVVRYGDAAGLAGLPIGWRALANRVLPALYALGLVALVVAIARPRSGIAESRVRSDGIDIVLLLDVSPSMAAEDLVAGNMIANRLDAAKEVLARFVARRRHDRIGLVAFSALPYSVAPLTLDHGWLISQMRRLNTGDLGDGTGIGIGIAAAVNRLRDSKAKSRIVVLLTDGINNIGELTPINAALAAQAIGVRIYTVGTGSEGIVRVPVRGPFGRTRYVQQRSDIDEDTLRRIADLTGGKFFRASDFASLDRVHREIDALETTEIEIERFTRFEELFQPFALAAMLLLGLEQLLSLSRIGRLP